MLGSETSEQRFATSTFCSENRNLADFPIYFRRFTTTGDVVSLSRILSSCNRVCQATRRSHRFIIHGESVAFSLTMMIGGRGGERERGDTRCAKVLRNDENPRPEGVDIAKVIKDRCQCLLSLAKIVNIFVNCFFSSKGREIIAILRFFLVARSLGFFSALIFLARRLARDKTRVSMKKSIRLSICTLSKGCSTKKE